MFAKLQGLFDYIDNSKQGYYVDDSSLIYTQVQA